jgi:GNAT superfamily N-acetyltransferase
VRAPERRFGIAGDSIAELHRRNNASSQRLVWHSMSRSTSQRRARTRRDQVAGPSLEATARTAIAEHVRLYDARDLVVVHDEACRLRLVYRSARASPQRRPAASLQCCVDSPRGPLWIAHVHVCRRLRGQGVGRELVLAAEATARAIGLPAVRVYPLPDAADFWRSLGYVTDPRTARVLQKRVGAAN